MSKFLPSYTHQKIFIWGQWGQTSDWGPCPSLAPTRTAQNGQIASRLWLSLLAWRRRLIQEASGYYKDNDTSLLKFTEITIRVKFTACLEQVVNILKLTLTCSV